ncbi:MAG: COX15/CtaA family protein [Armatimonadetes bacterium]|nr:COX15/CtaA family protein [Armatimonadota bacterium]MDW8028666.1 COX15/CtaA family protein [Armatimonadota bacterium]
MVVTKKATKNSSRRAVWVYLFAVVVAITTVALIAAGALVTSTKSGDAIPDWPTSYGALVPQQLVGGILYEWAHRAIAGITALLVLALTILLTFSPAPKWLKGLSWFALLAVIAQAILGGLRVLVVSHEKVQAAAIAITDAPHPDALRIAFAVAHATLAQIVLGLAFAIALFTKPIDREGNLLASKKLSFRLNGFTALALVITTLIFAQLLFGALMRHNDAGLIIPDFPTSFGKLFPDFGNLPFDPNNPQRMTYDEFAFKVAIHFAHRLNGFLIAILIGVLFWMATVKDQIAKPLRQLTLVKFALVVIQVFLGGLAIWTSLSVPITVAHVAIGATLLGLSILTICHIVLGETKFEQIAKVAET